MKRLIIIVFIACILLTGASLELLTIHNITSNLKNEIYNLLPQYEENAQDISIFTDKVSELNDKWNKIDANLGLIFNYKDLNQVTDSLSKLVIYTKENEYSDALTELTLLRNFVEKNEYTMGFNLHNVF